MRKILILAAVIFVSGCVSNKSVQTVQLGDTNKSCDRLRAELAQLGVTFDNVKGDSGVTGKNVGLAIVFWPGIIVNEIRSNSNENSIDARIQHLTTVYNDKCSDVDEPKGSLKETLVELKSMHDEGLLTTEEYGTARAKAVSSI
jgi:hypothetical protein